MIVEAFRQLGDEYELIVGGDGPERERLEALAPSNVEFVGYVSEEEKRRRLAECRALIFAAENEDFGMVPVEAFASGTPVVGVDDGFTRHQVRDGENGVLFGRSPPELADAIRRFDREGVDYSPAEIQEFAEQFSLTRFCARMRGIVTEAWGRSRVDPELEVPDLPAEKGHAVVTDGGENE